MRTKRNKPSQICNDGNANIHRAKPNLQELFPVGEASSLDISGPT